MSSCLLLEANGRVLFLAMGGGGDVALSSVLALAHERCGGEAVIGSILWERYVVDPVPGPILIDELVNVVERGPGYAIISHETFAVRGGRALAPQAVNIASVLGRNVAVFDISLGSIGLAKALKDFAEKFNVNAIVGIDVGGDSIAEGFEEELWSPLADAIALAALAHLQRTYVAIACPGADGELSLDHIERRIRRIARLGGYIGGYVLSKKDLDMLKEILRKVVSEASAVPLAVLNTDLDSISIRGESRKVKLSLLNLTVYILDAVTAVRDSLARYVYESSSLEEARQMLNRLMIVTEYDLEEEILNELLSRGSYVELNLLNIKNRVKSRLAKQHLAIRHNGM